MQPTHLSSLTQLPHKDSQRMALYQQTPGFTIEQKRTSLVPHEQALSGMTTLNIEEKIKQELDSKYRSRFEELEQKSLLLDQSLQVVEEMKEKFSSYEQQQTEYNSLLMKYNQLLCQQASSGMNGTA